jgi:hypothetical protein
MTVLWRLWLLEIAKSTEYAAVTVLSSVTVCGLSVAKVSSVSYGGRTCRSAAVQLGFSNTDCGSNL